MIDFFSAGDFRLKLEKIPRIINPLSLQSNDKP